jgi:hypothetical protein
MPHPQAKPTDPTPSADLIHWSGSLPTRQQHARLSDIIIAAAPDRQRGEANSAAPKTASFMEKGRAVSTAFLFCRNFSGLALASRTR